MMNRPKPGTLLQPKFDKRRNPVKLARYLSDKGSAIEIEPPITINGGVLRFWTLEDFRIVRKGHE